YRHARPPRHVGVRDDEAAWPQHSRAPRDAVVGELNGHAAQLFGEAGKIEQRVGHHPRRVRSPTVRRISRGSPPRATDSVTVSPTWCGRKTVRRSSGSVIRAPPSDTRMSPSMRPAADAGLSGWTSTMITALR